MKIVRFQVVLGQHCINKRTLVTLSYFIKNRGERMQPRPWALGKQIARYTVTDEESSPPLNMNPIGKAVRKRQRTASVNSSRKASAVIGALRRSLACDRVVLKANSLPCNLSRTKSVANRNPACLSSIFLALTNESNYRIRRVSDACPTPTSTVEHDKHRSAAAKRVQPSSR